jgi:hypothetical protein
MQPSLIDNILLNEASFELLKLEHTDLAFSQGRVTRNATTLDEFTSYP